MTLNDVVEAVNERLVLRWPDRTVYLDVCPVDFQRPGFWLRDIRGRQEILTPFLVRRTLSLELVIYDEVDDHYEASALRLMEDGAAVFDLLAPPLRAGDRCVTLTVEALGREPDAAFFALSGEWLDDRPGAEDPEGGPLMEEFHVTVNP